MPSAHFDLQTEWKSSTHAVRYLRTWGYRLHADYTWTAPYSHEPIPKELRAIYYLICEWDFGRLRGEW